jgi:hypothetical protein
MQEITIAHVVVAIISAVFAGGGAAAVVTWRLDSFVLNKLNGRYLHSEIANERLSNLDEKLDALAEKLHSGIANERLSNLDEKLDALAEKVEHLPYYLRRPTAYPSDRS